MELLKRTNVKISGKRAVVIGRSNIVGMPVALLLQAEDATVTVVHSRTPQPEVSPLQSLAAIIFDLACLQTICKHSNPVYIYSSSSQRLLCSKLLPMWSQNSSALGCGSELAFHRGEQAYGYCVLAGSSSQQSNDAFSMKIAVTSEMPFTIRPTLCSSSS